MLESIQPAVRHYHSLIRRDLAAAEDQERLLVELQHERDVLFGGRPMARSLRPVLLGESTYTDVQDTVYLIRQAVLRIAGRFFTDANLLRSELGLAEWEMELASIPTNVIRLSAAARMDSFLTPNSFKFVEINGESPAGPAYLHELADIYRQLPIFQEFIRRYPVRYVSPLPHTLSGLLHVYRDEFEGTAERPSFAVVDRLDVPTVHEFRLFKSYVERQGYACEIIDPRELECRDGWVFANGRKIDILYRRLLTSEYYGMRDDCRAFLEGYRAQKTCYLNSFRTSLVHKKAIFAFLTDERFSNVLTPEQQYAVNDHIPWTRMLRECRTRFRGLPIDLVEFVRSNRRYFVIKPNDDYGGAGVTLGFASSESEWDEAIRTGLQRPHVVQEAVDIHREPFLVNRNGGWDEVPSVVDLDPYIFGPMTGGILTRVSGSNLANVTAGGGTLPMFILRYA
jgi:uncharacterized circularly permuted ATP-grasp superfamily protein